MIKATFTVCKFCGMEIKREKDIYKHMSTKHDHDLYLLVVMAYGDKDDYIAFNERGEMVQVQEVTPK
jgi:hypothetical protein